MTAPPLAGAADDCAVLIGASPFGSRFITRPGMSYVLVCDPDEDETPAAEHALAIHRVPHRTNPPPHQRFPGWPASVLSSRSRSWAGFQPRNAAGRGSDLLMDDATVPAAGVAADSAECTDTG
ncbi:hypothetical protein ABZT48_09720 [Streptomyces avermitilis]|uniref:hypothetical protein n=1 Tax=Streptomyces avermitilis TaxID=33903 RepID=UPI0033A8C98B